MPGERRNLRSSKETSSQTNGEKARSDSQSSSSKDKPVPTRATSSKGKAIPPKKALTNSAKDGNEDKPQTNGNGPIENGVNGTEDVEMADDSAVAVKGGTVKDGEDEMVLVVPPPKSSKLSGEPGKDGEGDVAMENTEHAETGQPESEKLDPKIKAVSGQYHDRLVGAKSALSIARFHMLTLLLPRYESQFHVA